MFSFVIIQHPRSFIIEDIYIDKILECISQYVDIPQYWLINIAFLPDDEIQVLNHKHRWIDRTTDVLSFHYHEDFSALDTDEIAGEIIFSESRILSQSEEYGHVPTEEFYILLIHSALHLLWYDHEEDEDFKTMWFHEEKIRQQMNLNTKR